MSNAKCKSCGHSCHCNKECKECVNDICYNCKCNEEIPSTFLKRN